MNISMRKINQTNISVKEYKNQCVVTYKDVDTFRYNRAAVERFAEILDKKGAVS